LRIGSLIHDAAYAYYHLGIDLMDAYRDYANAEIERCRQVAPGGELWDEEKEKLVADLTLVRGMLKGYLTWQDESAGREMWADDQLEYLKMERKFSMDYHGVQMEGRIDGLARRRDSGELVVVERKTCRSIPELKGSLQWDFQPKVYAAAAEHMLGEPVPYVLYDMMQKSNPYNIPTLKNGLPSKAKANPSTPAAYLEVLQECMDTMELSIAERDAVLQEYAPHLNWLLVEPSVFFERWALPVSETEKTFALEQMHASYYRMREDWWHILDGTWPEKVAAKLDRFDCPNSKICSFNQVCATINQGGPWETLLENHFVQGEQETQYAADPE
jgi:hypothetical protein